MRTYFILLSSVVLACGLAHAQENTSSTPIKASQISDEPEIPLQDLIRLALQNNAQPQIAVANLEAARARAGAARASQNPTLQIVPGMGGNSASRDEEIILSQPFDLFGQRRANRRVLEAQTRAAQANLTVANRALIVSVKNAAAELFSAQEAESLGQSQVEIAQAFRDAATRKAELGDAPPIQAQRAQLELDRAQLALDQSSAERLSRRATLNQLIGASPAAPLRVALPEAGGLPLGDPVMSSPLSDSPGNATPSLTPPIIGGSSQVGSDLVATRALLLPGALQRPDVLAAQASAEAARAQTTAIARQTRPLVELQVRRGGVFDSASTSLRAVITVPIFDFGSIKRERFAAQFDARAQEIQVELLRSQVAAQLETAIVRLNQDRLTVQRYRDSLVPQTLDLLRKTQVGYAAGASTYLEVLESQRAARQIQAEYLQALVGMQTGEVALEAAIGSDISPALRDAPQVPAPNIQQGAPQ